MDQRTQTQRPPICTAVPQVLFIVYFWPVAAFPSQRDWVIMTEHLRDLQSLGYVVSSRPQLTFVIMHNFPWKHKFLLMPVKLHSFVCYAKQVMWILGISFRAATEGGVWRIHFLGLTWQSFRDWVTSNNRNSFSHSSRGQKFKVKASLELVRPETERGSIPGCPPGL
jgi:hypothetical protein